MPSLIEEFSQLRAAAQPPRVIDSSRPLWIFGAGGFGKSLCQAMLGRGIQVAGFVETSPKSSAVLDLPIVDWATLGQKAPNAQIAIGILNRGMPYDQLIQIAKQAGFTDLLMPWDTYDQFDKELGWRFWLSTREILTSGLDRIAAVSSRLADEESRRTLKRITAFRLGLDTDYASVSSADNQYFNDFTLRRLRNIPMTYVDCGAYNGDTYLDLVAQEAIHCRQSFLLEPDPENFAALVANTAAQGKQENTVCLPLAAADRYAILTFSSGQGEGGAIGAHGNMSIAAVALDEMLGNTHIDFLKLDVEGAEAQVLKGAEKTIARCRPVLALSLYHNPQDLWVLPELLFAMCQGYDFYIRQHFFNSFDSVLYAVPQNH